MVFSGNGSEGREGWGICDTYLSLPLPTANLVGYSGGNSPDAKRTRRKYGRKYAQQKKVRERTVQVICNIRNNRWLFHEPKFSPIHA
jgi:hypothetical protein